MEFCRDTKSYEVKNESYHHIESRSENFKETEDPAKTEIEEDEFELFLNGPFPKK